MKKRIILIVAVLIVAVGGYFAYEYFRINHYPLPVPPSESWEPFVNSLDAERETVLIERDGIKLEADVFIPNGGQERKPAVVFTPGSGDSLVQNYSWGLQKEECR